MLDWRKLLLVSLVLFLAATTVRLIALVRSTPDFRTDCYYSQDEREYDGLALGLMARGEYRQADPRQGLRVLARSGEPTAFRTPGMPAILAAIHTMFGGGQARARVVLAIGNSLAAPLLFLLCCLLGLRPALSALVGGLLALSPTGVYLSSVFYGEEPSCVILLVVTILTILAERRSSAALIAVAGLILGFGILTRGFLLFIPFTLAVWLFGRGRRRLVIYLLAGSAILPSLWMIRNVTTMGVWALSTESWEAVWLGNNRWARGSWPSQWPEQHQELLQKYPDFDQRDELGQAKVFQLEAKADLRNHPTRQLWLIPRKVAIFFWPRSWMGTDWTFALMLPFFAFGTVLLWRERRSRHLLALIGLPIASVFAVSILAFSDVRYRHPIDAMVFTIGGFGLDWIVARAKRRFGKGGLLASPPPSLDSV